MTAQEKILREKLANYFGEVFEPELIDEIVQVGFLDKIKSGSTMIEIGDKMTHIPLILEGVVKIIRQEKEGEELVIYYLEQGDTCAISFINCINRKESIFKGIAEKDTEAIFVPVEKVDEWLASFRSWRNFIIDSYHFRLLEMVESIDSLAFMNMSERIHKYLSNRVKISKDVDLKITHQDIADDLNTSRVVVTRILKELHDNGKIYATRNKIRVLDFDQND